MSTANDYRSNAEDCLRMASKASEERDRPLWATMAQSWLRLAEHADRMDLKFAPEDSTPEAELAEARHPN
jgi:hypothetical protein